MNNPTPTARQQWLLDLLKSEPTLSYTEGFAKHSLNYAKSKRTFDKDWKKAQQQYKEYQIKVNKAKENISIKEEVKGAKKGIKTKHDRLLNLQILVDTCFTDLAEGNTDDVYIDRKTGVPKEFRRKMTRAEVNQTRKTLKDLQAEISKIEGDYAPKEIENKIVMPTATVVMPDGMNLEDVLKDLEK